MRLRDTSGNISGYATVTRDLTERNMFARESFRHHSYFSDIAVGVISGLGAEGYYAALLTGGAAGILRAEFIRQARDLARGMDQSESWLPADLGVVYGTGSTIDLLAWWLAHEESYSADQIAAILDRLIIAPLLDGKPIPHSAAG